MSTSTTTLAELHRRQERRDERRRLATRSATRRPARSSPRWASPARPTSTPPSRPRRRPSPSGRRRRPSERSLALLRIADEIEERGEELRADRVREHRQAAGADDQRGDPAGRRPDPLLRRRRADARGPRERRVHGRPHLQHPPRADRRRRPDHALELPLHDGDLEVRPGARRRQHGRPQAVREHADLDALDGRADAEAPARGRVQRRARQGRRRRADRRATRASRWSRSPARCARARPSPRPPRTRSSASTSSSAARRR